MSTMTETQYTDRIKELNGYIQLMRESGKQLVTLTSILPTLYFAVLSFSDLRKSVQGLEILPFLAPAIPWLICQILIAQIFLPQPVPQETLAERTDRLYRQAGTYQRRLFIAYCWLIGGLVLLVAELGYYLAYVPVPPTKP